MSGDDPFAWFAAHEASALARLKQVIRWFWPNGVDCMPRSLD